MTIPPEPIPLLLKPGSLPSRCNHLELDTYQGVHLFLGQRREGKRPGYPGLRQFAANAAVAYREAAKDDPWADWRLIRIEAAIERSANDLTQLNNRLAEEVLTQAPCVDFDTRSEDPAKVSLHFATPYAYLGAGLLSQYDAYVRRLIHARHIALVDRNELSQWIRKGRKAVIRAYLSASGYRVFNVSRSDLDSGNSRVRDARVQLGELPQGIAEGANRARHAPTIVTQRTGPVRQPRGERGVVRLNAS